MYRRKIKEVLDQTVYFVREAETVKSNSESLFQQLLVNMIMFYESTKKYWLIYKI